MTIRLRLTLAFLAIFALLTGLRAVISIGGFRQAVEAEARHEVSGRLTAVADYLTFLAAERRSEGLPATFDWQAPETLPRAFSDDGMLIQIRAEDGTILARSPNLAPASLPLAAAGLSRQAVGRGQEEGAVDATLGSRKFSAPGAPALVLQAALPMSRQERTIVSHEAVEGGVAALSLLFALIAGYAMAGSALAPAAALNSQMKALTATDLHRRLPAPAVPRDEMEHLAVTFNGLLDRIERAFDAQRRFVADASHELKSPLTAIRGYHQLLLKRGESHPAQAREWIGTVSQETERLSRLVEELLLLARADAGQLVQAAPRPLRLDALASDIVRKLSPLQARLSLGSAAPAPVRGDADQLTRLLGNLVDNALRATQAAGSVTLSVATEGAWAVLRVADTGTGIAPEAMPHLFDRFYRADPARDRGHGGAGLGLAICQAIVEAHHGQLAVDSTLGRGTVFTVRLPLDIPA